MEFVPMRPSLWRQPVCLMPNCLMGWSVKYLDGVPLRTVRPLLHIQLQNKSHFHSGFNVVFNIKEPVNLDFHSNTEIKIIFLYNSFVALVVIFGKIVLFGKIVFFHLLFTAQFGSNHLLEANVLLISQEKCSKSSIYGKVLDDTMFCAGHLQGGIDSCQVSRGNSAHTIIYNICMTDLPEVNWVQLCVHFLSGQLCALVSGWLWRTTDLSADQHQRYLWSGELGRPMWKEEQAWGLHTGHSVRGLDQVKDSSSICISKHYYSSWFSFCVLKRKRQNTF